MEAWVLRESVEKMVGRGAEASGGAGRGLDDCYGPWYGDRKTCVVNTGAHGSIWVESTGEGWTGTVE